MEISSELGLEPDPLALDLGCFDPYPLPLLYIRLFGRLGVYFNQRVRDMLPQRRNLTPF